MKKKTLKYLVFLLIIPFIISISIALYNSTSYNYDDSNYDSIDGNFNHPTNYSKEESIKKSDPFIYLSIFTFIIAGVGVWVYVKKKGDL